jgi:hypothetical protein
LSTRRLTRASTGSSATGPPASTSPPRARPRPATSTTASIDAPGFPITIPWGINNQGQIVGLITAQLPLATDTHGFVLRRGAGGPLTQIDFPGASGTLASGIDDRGRIVGLYGNPAAAAPSPQPAGMPPVGMPGLLGPAG